MEHLTACTNDLKRAKDSAKEEVKKEKARSDEVVQAVNVVQNSLEMANLAEVEFQKAKVDIEARVDSLESKVKMSEDLLARELAEKAK